MDLRLTDNSRVLEKDLIKYIENVFNGGLINRTLSDLIKNKDIFFYPSRLSLYDDIEDDLLFRTWEGKLWTTNLMGFIGISQEGKEPIDLTIHSRFDGKGANDYFLHYLLQKELGYHRINVNHGVSDEPILDYLMYLFPTYLSKALKQGIYRYYKNQESNDSSVKGIINVARHIKDNTPFRGRISCDVNEYSADNELSQLIRHTIEFIRQRKDGSKVLAQVKDEVKTIVMLTPSYSKRERARVVSSNLRPVNHPLYTDYRNLQKICVQILRHHKIKYGNDKNKVWGVLFDGAWLWEEYLSWLLKEDGFIHSISSKNYKEKGIEPFGDDKRIVYNNALFPDFYNQDARIIMDAKYKSIDNKGINRKDFLQITSYLHCSNSRIAGIIYPSNNEQTIKQNIRTNELLGYGGRLCTIPFYIPPGALNWEDFCNKMKESENTFKSYIKELVSEASQT